MRRFLLKIGCGLALSVSLSAIQAQESWSLRRCIDYAIGNNIEVKQRELEKENVAIKLHTSKMSRLPDLNASVGQDFYFGRSPSRDGLYKDQSQASSSFRVGTNVPVFTGFRIPNEIAAGKLDLKAAVEELNKTREDVSLRVMSYYLQVLFNKELLKVAKEQVALSRSQLEKTRLLVANGKSPESALYETQSLLAKDELNLTQAENNLSLSLLDIAQLLNLTDAAQFDIEEPDMDQLSIEQVASLIVPREAYQHSLGIRPSIKAAEYALESSKYGIKLAKSAYYPTLSFGASYSNSYYYAYKSESQNPEFLQQMRNNGSESIGLSLSVPIFNRFGTRNQVKQARIRAANQELMLQNARQNLYKEIEQAYYTAVAAHKKFISSGKSVDAARIALEYEQKKYDAGKSTAFEYNDVKTRYEKSLSEEIQARYEFLFRSKVLDFYNGKPLDI